MGWAARLNPKASEHPRMRRLRNLCRVMPRMAVLDALPKMREADRLLVLQMLDEVQPVKAS